MRRLCKKSVEANWIRSLSLMCVSSKPQTALRSEGTTDSGQDDLGVLADVRSVQGVTDDVLCCRIGFLAFSSIRRNSHRMSGCDVLGHQNESRPDNRRVAQLSSRRHVVAVHAERSGGFRSNGAVERNEPIPQDRSQRRERPRGKGGTALVVRHVSLL